MKYGSVLFLAHISLLLAYRYPARASNYLNYPLSVSLIEHNNRDIKEAPIDSIIPYLSEHIQLSDQLLFLGASTDMVVKLSKIGYGTRKTGFITCVEENLSNIEKCRQLAAADPIVSEHLANGKLNFKWVSSYADMADVCKQSHFDAIVDYGGLDSIHLDPNLDEQTRPDKLLAAIDHLQNAVRLGNILVCLSALEKRVFCPVFESRFGWVQELDGDPGEISQWYRGKSNIAASKSQFQQLGLKMYVYTNTDNC